MFSTTTIAASTAKPTAMVIAISERLSRLKPSRYIAAVAPASESGTTTAGIKVARTLRRNSRITSTTRPIVSANVNSTSATEARTACGRPQLGAAAPVARKRPDREPPGPDRERHRNRAVGNVGGDRRRGVDEGVDRRQTIRA